MPRRTPPVIRWEPQVTTLLDIVVELDITSLDAQFSIEKIALNQLLDEVSTPKFKVAGHDIRMLIHPVPSDLEFCLCIFWTEEPDGAIRMLRAHFADSEEL